MCSFYCIAAMQTCKVIINGMRISDLFSLFCSSLFLFVASFCTSMDRSLHFSSNSDDHYKGVSNIIPQISFLVFSQFSKYFFPSYTQNVVFVGRKKRTKLPELGGASVNPIRRLYRNVFSKYFDTIPPLIFLSTMHTYSATHTQATTHAPALTDQPPRSSHQPPYPRLVCKYI